MVLINSRENVAFVAKEVHNLSINTETHENVIQLPKYYYNSSIAVFIKPTSVIIRADRD